MMAMGIGSVVALLCAGRVLAHHAPRRIVPVLGFVCAVAICSLLVPGSYRWLLVLMLAYGVAAALFDVALNDEATMIERATGRHS